MVRLKWRELDDSEDIISYHSARTVCEMNTRITSAIGALSDMFKGGLLSWSTDLIVYEGVDTLEKKTCLCH